VYDKEQRNNRPSKANKIVKSEKKRENRKHTLSKKQIVIHDTPTSMQHDMNRLSMVFIHTNVSFENMLAILPLMNAQRLGEVLTYYKNFRVTGREEEALATKPTDVEFALALSNMGLAHIINGDRNLAENMIKQAKNSAIDILDLGTSRFETAACNAYFCEYFAYAGDADRTKFYLRQLRAYLDKNINTEPTTIFLHTMHYACLCYVSEDIDLGKFFEYGATVLTGQIIPCPPLLTEFDIDNCLAHHNAALDSLSPSSDKEFKKKVMHLMSLGAKLQYLTRLTQVERIDGIELGPMTLKIADDVIPAIKEVNALATYMIHFIKQAAIVHMNAIATNFALQCLPNLIEELSTLKDAAAMSQMTWKIHEPFINSLERFIEPFRVMVLKDTTL
jgi:hypothetical protein